MNHSLLAQVDFGKLNRTLEGENFQFANKKIGELISALLPYLLVFAGLGVLVYLLWGGFQLMTSGGDPKMVEQGKGKVTGAFIGFLVIFMAYWLVQILETIFGLKTGIF